MDENAFAFRLSTPMKSVFDIADYSINLERLSL